MTSRDFLRIKLTSYRMLVLQPVSHLKFSMNLVQAPGKLFPHLEWL